MLAYNQCTGQKSADKIQTLKGFHKGKSSGKLIFHRPWAKSAKPAITHISSAARDHFLKAIAKIAHFNKRKNSAILFSPFF
ncbi:MAG: hypothetical protein KDD06_06645 [Phaeodactylibacter sp.]|nr:hypothetical protein [Phaeodactylibacter sp.]MCB9264604.1 hypothetical protein [Lewinellaceae bacterium]MCB9287293.1 hypothetical protein [Lewinellaceae bacterium]